MTGIEQLPVNGKTKAAKRRLTRAKMGRAPGELLPSQLGGTATRAGASTPPVFRLGACRCLQPFDLGELVRGHLLYQIHDRLLLGCANLDELHAGHGRRS
jgi:hypothetical protein